jgi:hypothetical protein
MAYLFTVIEIAWRDWGKSQNNLNRGSQPPDQDMNQGLPEYESFCEISGFHGGKYED